MQRCDPLQLNVWVIEMQEWNIPMDRPRRADKKNGVICLVIMLVPRVIVIKMSKMAHFLHFLLMAGKH